MNPRVGLAALVALLVSTVATARISMRLPASRRAGAAIEQLGATPLLSHPMRVNGVDAMLSVHGVELSSAQVGARLRQSLNLPARDRRSADAQQWEWTQGGRHQTVFLLPMHAHQTVVLLIDAAAADWAQQRQRPIPPPEADWPLPPQAQLRFSARNDETRTAFSFADSPADAAVAAASVTASMRSGGWQPLSEGKNGALSVFVHRNGQIRVLLALPAPQGGGSRIALLQRPLITNRRTAEY